MKRIFSLMIVIFFVLGTLSISNFNLDTADAEVSNLWTATDTSKYSESGDGFARFENGNSGTYSQKISLNDGVNIRIIFDEGAEVPRLKDARIGLLFQSEIGLSYGSKAGLYYWIRPINTSAIQNGNHTITQSFYNKGKDDGAGTASNEKNGLVATPVEEKNSFYFNVLQLNGIFTINLNGNNYTTPFAFDNLDLDNLYLSVIFGGANVTIAPNFNFKIEVENGRMSEQFSTFCMDKISLDEEAGLLRVRENARRRGKIIYTRPLDMTKPIYAKIKINEKPTTVDDLWLGTFISDVPTAVYGSSKLGTISRPQRVIGSIERNPLIFDSQMVIKGSLQTQSGDILVGNADQSGFHTMKFLVGEASSVYEIDGVPYSTQAVKLSDFQNNIGYFGISMNDAVTAEDNYWDFSLKVYQEGDAALVNGNRIFQNVNPMDVNVCLNMFSDKFESLSFKKANETAVVFTASQVIQESSKDGQLYNIIFKKDFLQTLDKGIYTLSVKLEGKEIPLETTIDIRQSVISTIDKLTEDFDLTSSNDIVFTITLNDDLFNKVEGYGISATDYTFVDNNLTIKNVFLKGLGEGEVNLTIKMDLINFNVKINNYYPKEEEKPITNNGCNKNNVASLLAILGFATIIVLKNKFV